MISPKVVASAFHCAVSKQGRVPCDHSDRRRKVIIGRHEVRFRRDKLRSYRTISIIDVKYPARAGLHSDRDSHDFALFILERPVQYSDNVQSICLPRQNAEYGGEYRNSQKDFTSINFVTHYFELKVSFLF